MLNSVFNSGYRLRCLLRVTAFPFHSGSLITLSSSCVTAVEIDGSLWHDAANSLQREGSRLLAILISIPVSRTSAGPVTM